MNTLKNLAIILAVFAIFITSAHGQSFLNLNFESAYNLPGNPGSGVLLGATNALPGWNAYDGALRLFNVSYVSNSFSGPAENVGLDGGAVALSGTFSAALYPNGSISQSGLVPANAGALEFEASQGIDLSVALGGQELSFQILSAGTRYNLYGANIPSNLDGQMETLSFSALGFGSSLLDNIEFSTTSVPEPGEFALIGVGVVLFGGFRLRARLRRDLGRGGRTLLR